METGSSATVLPLLVDSLLLERSSLPPRVLDSRMPAPAMADPTSVEGDDEVTEKEEEEVEMVDDEDVEGRTAA